MKKNNILIIIFIFIASFAHSQNKYATYCDIIVYGGANLLNKYSSINFDFGGQYKCDLIDDNNQVINFYSYIDAVNYLTKLGWNLKETYTVNTFAPTMPKEFEWLDVVHCIMEKMISSDDEKLDGLKLSSFTKNENKEKTSIQNDGKKKIVLSKRRHN